MVDKSRSSLSCSQLLGRVRSACIAASLLLIAGCGDPLPEYYGVYLKKGGSLTDLQDMDSSEFVLRGNDSIILYQKEVGAGGFAPLEYARLIKPSHAVRYEIESDAQGQHEIPLAGLRIHQVSKYGPADHIPFRAKPVANQPEMVELVTAQALDSGTYFLTLNGQPFAYFAVGFEPTQHFTSNNPGCIDSRTWTEDVGKRFSWEGFGRLAAGGLRGEKNRSASGKVIMRDEKWPCEKSDEFLDAVETQIQLREFSRHAVQSMCFIVNTLLLANVSPDDLGLSADNWSPLDLEKIRLGMRNTTSRWVEEVLPRDGWGNSLQGKLFYYDDDELPATAIRSLGSDSLPVEEWYQSLAELGYGEVTVGEDDFAADLVCAGKMWVQAPASWTS